MPWISGTPIAAVGFAQIQELVGTDTIAHFDRIIVGLQEVRLLA